MFLRHNSPALSAVPITYTVRLNNVATALLVKIAANVADGSDLVDAVAGAQGDLVDIEVTKGGVLMGGSPHQIIASVELA
jgi:hypothetical protein